MIAVGVCGLAGGSAEILQILWKRAAGQSLIEGEIRLRHGTEVTIQECTKDRLLVRNVMVDVPLRDLGGFGDVADARGTKATVRKELQCGVENHVATALGALFLVHSGLAMSLSRNFPFSTLP